MISKKVRNEIADTYAAFASTPKSAHNMRWSEVLATMNLSRAAQKYFWSKFDSTLVPLGQDIKPNAWVEYYAEMEARWRLDEV